MGYEIRIIGLPDTILHLDKVLMALGEKTVLYCKELVPETKLEGFTKLGISCGEDTTANIICLGDGELIVNKSNVRVIELLQTQGYIVQALNLSEFAKGMGGPNCLIMPVKRGAL